MGNQADSLDFVNKSRRTRIGCQRCCLGHLFISTPPIWLDWAVPRT